MLTDYKFDPPVFFFFQAEDGIRDWSVTGVQTCALPILANCANWFGGVYQDPKNQFAQFAMDVPTMFDLFPDTVLPEDQKKAFLAERTSRSEERRVGKEGRSRWSPYH